jgi:glycosyltransferase involved in cell wall biosynthesis
MDLSVALAVFNEETNLLNCLNSIKNISNDIVIVDGGSSDQTINIAKKFGAKVIITDNPPIFHVNKQKALNLCKSDWILQLDADEIVSPELALEIKKTINTSKITPNFNGYYIARRNHFWGRIMTKGGLSPDYVIRLVKKEAAKFPCKTVHEQIEINGEVGYLKNPLDHYAYQTYADYWRKADSYIYLTALDMKKNLSNPGLLDIGYCFIYKPLVEFFNRYIRHKGFLDGWQGLVFAYFSAKHFPKAYIKYLKIR